MVNLFPFGGRSSILMTNILFELVGETMELRHLIWDAISSLLFSAHGCYGWYVLRDDPISLKHGGIENDDYAMDHEGTL